MNTERRCARHKQVKTLRRHLKSYITLCNITSCNIMEKWKNRPATVCALHNKVYNITLCNIIEKWKNRPATVCATGNLLRNNTYLLTIMTNNVLADLHPRVKFVVDTSAIVCSIRPSLTFTIFLWITT